ncbi:RagB/SusD family nutrient uptake outer membrane protein [Agriterribacter sp.]|uniref:RagB/SusD family nutrient uptake outer membrane protein n=1 Tax=Agriterribacter sp. TaxID=2821509 RepID=UPI002B918C35|nr:RagB/SusD family nutrient uptake outer membrane protein [Agriterribacter sp.]HRO46750.1 RagB/SusD family nutrient uptake outer membrane protein [Agriterribacter sp.]
MTQHKYNIQTLLFTFLMFLLSFSCKKALKIEPSSNILTPDQIFSDSSLSTAAVVGIYINMMNYSTQFKFGNGGIGCFGGLSADELYSTTQDPSEQELYSNGISPENNTINASLWQQGFQLLYQTNACIEQLEATQLLASSVQNHLLGECKFMRAFIYFYLINIYDEVPLVLSTDYTVNALLPKTPSTKIYEQIIKDLQEAQSTISVNYISANRARPNRATVEALLARVYLYQQNWTLAEQAADNLIDNNEYELENEPDRVFLSASRETIWQMQPVQTGFETAEGFLYVPYVSTIIPNYIVSDQLIKAFEPTDKRKTFWLNSNDFDGQFYFYPFKYRLGYDGTETPEEFLKVFRLAEIYLIRSEAKAQQNNPGGALDDLNKIRLRAGLVAFNSSNKDEILKAIEHERQTELCFEWGHRWFDLKRTGLINEILTTVKPGWKPTSATFPIPFGELQSNPNLSQNPGY